MLTPAFIDIGTASLFADGIQTQPVDQLANLVVLLRGVQTYPQPLRPPLCGRIGGLLTANLNQLVTHDCAVYRMIDQRSH